MKLYLAALLTATPAFAAAIPPTPAQTVVVTDRPTIPVYAGRDPDKIASDETIITQIIPLQYLSAVEVLNVLTAIARPDMPIAAVSNSIVVTDTSARVKRIVQIIALLDVSRPGDNIIQVVPLHSSNAAEAARQINALFTPNN